MLFKQAILYYENCVKTQAQCVGELQGFSLSKQVVCIVTTVFQSAKHDAMLNYWGTEVKVPRWSRQLHASASLISGKKPFTGFKYEFFT